MNDGCPICTGGGPEDAVAELEASTLALPERAAMRGYAALFLRRHAVELHDLAPEEAAAFMRDVQRVSRAIAGAVRPDKMNYEVHGNTIAHLHMHFFPRWRDDPFHGGPIRPGAITHAVYAPGEFDQVRARIVEALR